MPIHERSELKAWNSAARKLQERMRYDPDVCGAVPHFVWHYLADADIRRKSEEYKLEQDHQILEIIQALERGEVPHG